MQKHHTGLRLSDMGKGLLTEGKIVLIETIHVCEDSHHILTWTSLNLPPKTLAVINTRVDLKGKLQNEIYEAKIVYFQINIQIW